MGNAQLFKGEDKEGDLDSRVRGNDDKERPDFVTGLFRHYTSS